MTKATAAVTSKAMKTAAKKITPVPKHMPSVPSEGDCASSKPVVESGFSIFNPGVSMTKTAAAAPATIKATSSNFPEKKDSPEQIAKKEAAAKAATDKEAKKTAALAKAAEAKQARETAAAARAKTAADNKAAREARAEEMKAAGRTYTGSMTQLADRVKQGAYVKSLTGQLRSSDELAVALDAVPAANVVLLGIKALGLDGNPYAALNVGQQSMNLRNRMRGAIKKGTLTLDRVKEIRDTDGLATAEAEIAKKKEATALRLKTAEEAKETKRLADVKALEAKQKAEADALKAKTDTKAEKAKPAAKPAPIAQTGATA